MPALGSHTLIEAPEEEPVTLAQAKANCRVDTTDDDPVFTDMITQARALFERETHLALLTQTWRLELEDFPRCGTSLDIKLPQGPFQSLETITYIAENGDEVELDESLFFAVKGWMTGRVRSPNRAAWPATIGDGRMCVTIDYKAGYESVDLVPPDAIRAILLIVGEWYENREEAQPINLTRVPDGARRIMDNLLVGGFG